MNEIKLLWLLQEVEKKEHDMLQTCKTNLAVKDLRKNKDLIMQRQKEFEVYKHKYQTLNQDIKKSELEIATIMDKQKEILKKMYDGSTNNSKELAKMQQQSEQLKEQATALEENQLKSMEERERLHTFLKNEQEFLKSEIEKYKVQKMQYDFEKLNQEQELAQLGDEKEKLEQQIPEKLLQKFREQQKTFNGNSITYVGPNRICSYCSVEITRTVVDNALATPGKVHCESCSRIIYVG